MIVQPPESPAAEHELEVGGLDPGAEAGANGAPAPRPRRFVLLKPWRWRWLGRSLHGLAVLLSAAALAQFVVGALFVVGWAQNRMRRRILKIWQRPAPPPLSWRRRALQSGRRGLQAALCSALALLVPLGLLGFAWWSGWNTSFHKDVEQAAYGPLSGLLALLLFSLVMPLLPLAQARLALTEDWRSFFAVPFLFALARRHWLRCLGLGLIAAVLWVPVLWLQSAVSFFGNTATLEDMSDAELLNFARLYYFGGTALLVLPAFLWIRSLGARAYAQSLRRDVRRGKVPAERLHPAEREHLAAELALAPDPAPATPRWLRLVQGPSLAVVMLLSCLCWMSVGFLILIGQFLHFRPVEGWLNPVLAVLPWVKHLPDALQ